jgi:NAD(P)-dependent dehydrogenase (short-subunit alcohol dehydrogenase family)
MTIRLNDQVAIVTGAGGGLGRCHALALAARGAKVVVNDLGAEPAEAVAKEIRAAGGEAISHACSVSDYDAVEAMVSKVMDQWGRVDILVNNAGILRDKTFAKMELDDFTTVLDVHLMGSVNCTKAVWEIMRNQQYGRIVMTTSSSGLFGNFGQSNYGAAKLALVGLMQTLSLEGHKYNIRVNSLAPTAATQMTEGLMPAEVLEKLKPETVSPGVVFLCSEDAPSRTILAAGAGSFETAHITLTKGVYIGDDEDAADQIAAHFAQISDRTGDQVPGMGSAQGQQEISNLIASQQKG